MIARVAAPLTQCTPCRGFTEDTLLFFSACCENPGWTQGILSSAGETVLPQVVHLVYQHCQQVPRSPLHSNSIFSAPSYNVIIFTCACGVFSTLVGVSPTGLLKRTHKIARAEKPCYYLFCIQQSCCHSGLSGLHLPGHSVHSSIGLPHPACG